MSTIGQEKSVEAKIGGKTRIITFNGAAEYRMGTLDRPFQPADLKNPRRSWAALVAWVWACLSKTSDRLDYPSPEVLADHMKDRETIDACFIAWLESWSAANPADTPGNGQSSSGGASPA